MSQKEYMIFNVKTSKENLSNLESILPEDRARKDAKSHFNPPEFEYIFEHALTKKEIRKITDKLIEIDVIGWEFYAL